MILTQTKLNSTKIHGKMIIANHDFTCFFLDAFGARKMILANHDFTRKKSAPSAPKDKGFPTIKKQENVNIPKKMIIANLDFTRKIFRRLRRRKDDFSEP